MRLVESFLSIQGEGAAAGRLAIFVRFFGCNLNCAGFGVSAVLPDGKKAIGCDTIRAVNRAFSYEKKGAKDVLLDIAGLLNLQDNLPDNPRGVAKILYEFCKSKFYQIPIVVITGGEPLLNHQDVEFVHLVEALIEAGFSVHFETNGTIFIDFNHYEIYKKCEFAMSIKLASSGENEQKRVKKDAILSIANNSKDCFFKFVLKGDDAELAEIEQILSLLKDNEKKVDVWLMPMAANKTELASNALNVAQAAIKYGYNYTDRLHIRLWNDKEGV